MIRWTFKRALREVGLPGDYPLKTEEDFAKLMQVWKSLTVEARRGNNDDRAAVLSYCKTIFQKRWKARQSVICPACGKLKNIRSAHCQLCARTLRYYKNRLHSNDMDSDLHKPEPLTPITQIERRSGQLSNALRVLANGNIGDSFVTNRPSSSIGNLAKLLGGIVVCRIANPGEKDHKKRRYHVWRTDGLPPEKVNEIIERRMKGETVAKPAPWVPLPPAEQQKAKDRKHPKKPKNEPPGDA